MPSRRVNLAISLTILILLTFSVFFVAMSLDSKSGEWMTATTDFGDEPPEDYTKFEDIPPEYKSLFRKAVSQERVRLPDNMSRDFWTNRYIKYQGDIYFVGVVVS